MGSTGYFDFIVLYKRRKIITESAVFFMDYRKAKNLAVSALLWNPDGDSSDKKAREMDNSRKNSGSTCGSWAAVSPSAGRKSESNIFRCGTGRLYLYPAGKRSLLHY